ncbi:hypothetical protein DSL72_006995 [Monilinia vaccinii-corymbosi]|uniref:Uncharacterized protein n=1 Tax=Monilinia vaccinii-corymbosi TaxID=61207 RepID=A0A8A3PLJ0_9HELO|nr:hypothetical protein DSL72_006995 [Monilinia vaccinii-corymbosi]
MAHYQGWNQEESTRAREGQEERTYTVPSPLARTIEPSRTLRNTNICDIPDDVPIVPTPGGIKRSKLRSQNGRSTALPSLGSPNSVGVDDDSGQLKVSSPKRRKVTGRATQPAFKIPSKVPKVFTSEGFRGLPDNLHDGLSAPQLTTPPDTLKKSKTRVSSPMVGKRKKSPELFQSSAITKPSLLHFTSKSRDQSQSINRLQGFTTTEEQLRLNSNGIASTTLQKLGTFKHVPRDSSSVNQPIVVTGSLNNHEALGQYHDGQFCEESNRQSSGYDHNERIPGDSFFEEALWIPKQFVDSNELEISHPNLSQIHSLPSNLMTSVTQQIPDHVEYSPMPSEYSHTSSEARALENLLDDTATVVMEAKNPNQEPQSADISEAIQVDDMDPKFLDHGVHFPLVYVQTPRPGIEQEQAQTSHDSTILRPMANLGRHNIKFQVERSNIEDGEPALGSTFRNFSDDDDFNDGICDEDLLDLVTNSVHLAPLKSHMLQTSIQSSPHSNQRKVTVACTKTAQSNHPITLPQEVISAASSSFLMDEDDDFPMDADLQEEMFRLAGTNRSQDVVESFVPPPSIRLPSNGDDTDREVYDNTLQFSSPMSRESNLSEVARVQSTDANSPSKPPATSEEVDWGYITSSAMGPVKLQVKKPPEMDEPPKKLPAPVKPSRNSSAIKNWLDDSHEYLPLVPFARPKFPPLVQDRCPVNGVSAQTILRVCFRIGEMLKEGGRCNALGQDAIVELFARVNFSSREPGTTKQHFQFSDLFHDRPPFAKGLLANFKATGLAESESKVFVGSNETLMARCLGRLKRDAKNGTALLHIINVRVTDWEEIRWTKRIICGENQENAKDTAKL